MENNKNTQYELNKGLAQMLKGGVIMDVTTPEQARIAEAAGACAVMALERIPADIRAAGGVSRMSDPKMIKGIQEVFIKAVVLHENVILDIVLDDFFVNIKCTRFRFLSLPFRRLCRVL